MDVTMTVGTLLTLCFSVLCHEQPTKEYFGDLTKQKFEDWCNFNHEEKYYIPEAEVDWDGELMTGAGMKHDIETFRKEGYKCTEARTEILGVEMNGDEVTVEAHYYETSTIDGDSTVPQTEHDRKLFEQQQAASGKTIKYHITVVWIEVESGDWKIKKMVAKKIGVVETPLI